MDGVGSISEHHNTHTPLLVLCVRCELPLFTHSNERSGPIRLILLFCDVLVTCRSRVICKKVASRSGTIGAQSEN